jgi:hypothetical protein
MVLMYNPKAKRQSVEWRSKNSPRPKKPRMSNSKIKIILIASFDMRFITYFEFVPEEITANETLYVEMLERFIVAVILKRGRLWEIAPAYSWLRVSQF